jgi:hypothetical protein
MLEWFLGPQTIHPAGQHGVTAILADASSSMDPPLMMASLAQAKQHEPTARVFVFGDEVAEVRFPPRPTAPECRRLQATHEATHRADARRGSPSSLPGSQAYRPLPRRTARCGRRHR